MDNPFALISQRLENIEELISSFKEFMTSSNVRSLTSHQNLSSEEFLSSDEEIAEHLGCKKSTVLKYARNGVVPFYKAGRIYRFKKSEVDQALSSQTPIKRKKKGASAHG